MTLKCKTLLRTIVQLKLDYVDRLNGIIFNLDNRINLNLKQYFEESLSNSSLLSKHKFNIYLFYMKIHLISGQLLFEIELHEVRLEMRSRSSLVVQTSPTKRNIKKIYLQRLPAKTQRVKYPKSVIWSRL